MGMKYITLTSVLFVIVSLLIINTSIAGQKFGGRPIPGSKIEAIEGSPGSGNFFVSETTPQGIIHQVIESKDPITGDVFYQEVYVDNSRPKHIPSLPNNWANIAFKQSINDTTNHLTTNNNFSMIASIDDFGKRIGVSQHINDISNGLADYNFSIAPQYDAFNNFKGHDININTEMKDTMNGLGENSFNMRKSTNDIGEVISLQVDFKELIGDESIESSIKNRYKSDFEFNMISEPSASLEDDLAKLIDKTILEYEKDILTNLALQP